MIPPTRTPFMHLYFRDKEPVLLLRIQQVMVAGSLGELEFPHHQFDRDSGIYSEDELFQWQHLLSFLTMQQLLTADLTQGVSHDIEGCSLMPIPAAPSYALANLEHSVMGALAPAWFRDVCYYVGLTGGCLIIVVTMWILWQCIKAHCRPTLEPVAPTTAPKPTLVFMPPSFPVVSQTSFSPAPLAIEDHHVNTSTPLEVVVLPEGVYTTRTVRKMQPNGRLIIFRH